MDDEGGAARRARSAQLVAKMPWGGRDATRRELLRSRFQGGPLPVAREESAGRVAGIGRGGKGRRSGGSREGVDIDDHIRLAVREESAASLGRAGHRLQEAVAALADYDRGRSDGASGGQRQADPRQPDPLRLPFVAAAADALWAFVVQREAVGITSHELLDRIYGVTPELWRLMGSADAGDGILAPRAGPRG